MSDDGRESWTDARLSWAAVVSPTVIQIRRDERTLLRFSRISIARCTNGPFLRVCLGPLSQSVHPVTGARATGGRSCHPCQASTHPQAATSDTA